jgi:PAS domain S-box-containing protein
MNNHLPENEIRNIFMQAHLAIGIYKGADYTIGFANDLYLQILDSDNSILGKPVFEVFPELINQGIKEIFDNVRKTKKPFNINEHCAFIGKDTKTKRYFNCSYQMMTDEPNLMVVFSEVTDQVIIKNKNEAHQKKLLDKLSFQNQEKNDRANELEIANKELLYQNQEKQNRADELIIANKELLYQKNEKQNRADELEIANKELLFQNQEKQNRADELEIANKELVFQNKEKKDRADELGIANIELAHQQSEKQDRADELGIANIELAHQQSEKQDRADELGIANIELAHQQSEKQDRADELGIANIELAHQQSEKQDRADELGIANIELAFQKSEKINRADELGIANIELDFQKNLAQKQVYSRSLIEASKDPLVTINTDGKIMDMNEAMLKVTDKTREQLLNTDFCLYFTEKLKAQKVYQEVFEKGFVTNFPLVMKDGKLTDVLFNGSVYRDENDKVIGAVVVARDVSEQKKLERNLVEYKHLFNENLDFACIANPEGFFEVVNKSFEKVLGYTEAELLNTSFMDFLHPDDVESTQKELINLKEGHRTISFINRYLKKDGTYLLLDWKSNFNRVANKIYAIARDITEQKTTEQNLINSLREVTDYKLALDASTIVDITDKNGKILFVNENYTKISKYSYEELGGNHQMVNSTFHPKEFMNNLWQNISKGKIWQDEIRNKAKDGSFYWLNMTIVPFLDDKGIPYQYVAISIDITKQKVLSQELTEAKVFAELATTIAEDSRNNAEEAVKSKQQFLSNMSHEIRTPMNAIIGFTKVVLKTELTAKQKEYLMAIKMSGDALIVLINDILDLAKVDSGKMTFEKTPFKLSLSITSMLHLFETKIQEKNLSLITKYDAKIPEVLLGDAVRLNQIILNLVSNAVKFTNKGSITVSINLLSQDEDKATIEFSVADTGIGIKPTKISKIFENFQQATNTTSRLYGGTGLGLAIVKQLVEAQGGTIDIKTKINKGSTFRFILDFKKTTVEAVHEPEILELDSSIKNTKILVVEDMELNQLLMKTLLDDFGFECDITANGKLAIEKLKTKTYDIILMDLQMPEMNGFEATEYIRKKMKLEIPIIALTADVTTVDVEKCKAVGMNDYIAKPVDERLLYSKLISFSKKPVVIIEHIKGQDPAKDKIKYVDMSYLTKLTKSDPKLMSQMINAYLKQTPPLLETMKKSLRDKDWKMLQSAVHKMIPSFSIIGLNPSVQEIAKRIQEYAFSIEISEEIHNLVLELENVCTQSCEELEIELTNLNK